MAIQQKQLLSKRQLTDIYNIVTNEGVNTFRSQREAAVRVGEALRRVRPRARQVKPGRRAEFAEADTIHAIVANPKKPNTLAHERFALYKRGMTVGQYLAAGGTRADLRWDARHKFIEIRRS
jgi:hypothetical protein